MNNVRGEAEDIILNKVLKRGQLSNNEIPIKNSRETVHYSRQSQGHYTDNGQFQGYYLS